MYTLIQDSRKTSGDFLALRKKELRDSQFWTTDITQIFSYTEKVLAIKRAQNLRFNDVRVVPYDEAVALLESNKSGVITFEKPRTRKSIFEMDIWEYKNWLGWPDDSF